MTSPVLALDSVSLDGLVVRAVGAVLLGTQESDRAANAVTAAIGAVAAPLPFVDRVSEWFARPHLRMVSNVWKYLLVLALAVGLAGVDLAWLNLAGVDPMTAVVGGVALGCLTHAFGELRGVVLFDGLGFEYDTAQGAGMAPDTVREYVEFVGVSLPVLCTWEELLYRDVPVVVAHVVANALEFLVHESPLGEPLLTERLGFGA